MVDTSHGHQSTHNIAIWSAWRVVFHMQSQPVISAVAAPTWLSQPLPVFMMSFQVQVLDQSAMPSRLMPTRELQEEGRVPSTEQSAPEAPA